MHMYMHVAMKSGRMSHRCGIDGDDGGGIAPLVCSVIHS